MKKFLLLFIFGCAACTTQAQDPVTGSNKTAPAQSSNILADIKRAVGDATCSSSAECRTLPVGAKACGGPEEYVAWSTLHGSEAALQALAARSKTLRQEEIRRSGEMSICMHTPDPGASCVAGTCQLNTTARAD